MDQDLAKVGEVAGMLEAEILRSMLQAQDIQVLLSHEAAGTAIGLAAGPLGMVELWVRTEQAEAAREVLQAYHAGGASIEHETD